MNTWPVLIGLQVLERKWPLILKPRRNKVRLGDSVASWVRVEIYRYEVKVMVKVKVTQEQATKLQRWSRDIVLLFL